MKTALHRMVCLALCAAMLLAMLPGMATPAAADTAEEPAEAYLWVGHENGANQYVTTTVEELTADEAPEDEPDSFLPTGTTDGIPAANAITNYGGSYYYFETFKDLKNLVAQSTGSQIYASYEGTGDLVISENLTLPENMDLLMDNGAKLVINKGITFTTNYVSAKDFTVNGTWVLKRFANVYGHLDVNGTVRLTQGVLYLRSGGTISGLENVSKNYENQVLYYWDVRTVSDIEDAIAAAKNTGDGLPHGINMWVSDTLTIDKSLTIPENMVECSIYGKGTIIIPKGVTFTTCSPRMYLSCNVQVMGKFVNHGNIQFNSPATFEFTGTYGGKGKLQVYNQNGESKLSQIVTGLNLNAFIVQEYENWGSHWWEILDPVFVTQLGTPRNLQWHKNVAWKSDGTAYLASNVGSAAWTAVNPIVTDGITEFCVTLYRNGEAYSEYWIGYSQDYFDNTKYASADGLTIRTDDLPSGTYHFTVQARTDAPGYCNSAIATSDTWEYTKPSDRVKRPDTLSWDGMVAQWNKVAGAERYLYQFYYSPTKSGDPVSIGWSWAFTNSQEIYRYMLENNGPGYYYFKVRTLSEDITVKRHSAWSELSPAYYYSGNAKPAAPTVKSGVDAATGKPYVYWDRVPGANKYRVYRSTSKDGTYKSIVLLDSGTSMYGQYGYTDETAKVNTRYYYKVRAYSYTDVVSSYSNTVTRRTTLAQPKVSVSGNASTGKPVVSWNTVSGAEKYYVYRATSKDGTYKLVKTAISARSYEDTDAKAGTNYYYKVKAVHSNTDANSAYSSVVSRMCDLKRPVVTISLTSGGNPYLKWTEISGATKYYVYRATSKSGTYKYLGASTSGKYVDKDVTEGKTYYYKVKAIHAKSSANSAYSAIDSITAK